MPGWQHHGGLHATRPWLPPVWRQGARFPLSACVCTSGCEAAPGPSCPRCEVRPQPVVRDWSQQRTGRRGRGEETPTKMRRNAWAVCVSADVPKCYGYSSIYPGFSAFPLPKTQGQQANASVISASRFLPRPHSLRPLRRLLKNGCAVFGIHFTKTHRYNSPRRGAGTGRSSAPGRDLWTCAWKRDAFPGKIVGLCSRFRSIA